MAARWIAAGCIVGLLAACAGNGGVNVGVGASTTVSSGTSTSNTGVSLGVQVEGGGPATLLLGIGAIGAILYGNRSSEARPDGAGLPPQGSPPPPDPARKVQEVDCTRPIEDWTANIRCK